MAVHILDAEDSDGESWMEVLEGSPGPTVQNSRASSFCALDEVSGRIHDTASADEDEDESWASDFEDSDNSKTNYDTESQHYGHTQPSVNSSSTSSNQPLHLERPEIGDIQYHYNEVETLSKMHPDKASYYRLWLCWMYRMKSSDIQDLVRHAPDYILRVTNHLFSLHNHPFWKDSHNSNKYSYQWYAMYGVCIDVLAWWKNTKWHHQTPNSNQYDNGFGPFSVLDRDSPPPYDQLITPSLNDFPCLDPWSLGDALKFLEKIHKSVDDRLPEQADQRPIPFQAWIQWEQSAAARRSSSPQPGCMDGNDKDIPVYAFIQNSGLPPEAVNYSGLL